MRKTVLLVGAMLLTGTFIHAQTTLFSEDFESGSATGWTNVSNASDGGWLVGTGSSLQSSYFPITGNSTQMAVTNDDGCDCDKSNDLFYTPAINLTSATNAFLYFNLYYFEQSYGSGTEDLTLEISTDGGSTWTVEANLDAVAEWELMAYDISSYAGQTINIGWRYNDGADWLYGAGIDNVSVVEPASHDMGVTEVSVCNAGLNDGPIDITGTIVNYGATTITSFDLNYTVNGGSPVTQTVSSVNIAPLTSYSFTHSTQWTPSSAGTFAIDAYATNLNGTTPDPNSSNDIGTVNVNIYAETTTKTPLYEHFTSNTCAPCAAFNPGFQTLLVANTVNQGGVCAIKYQMSWPSPGDQSFNADGDSRRAYYGVSGIPQPVFEGAYASANQTEIDNASCKSPAIVEITGSATKDAANTITVNVDFNPLADISSSNLKAHIAIVEDQYNNTQGTNGETTFYQVMRKMLPDGNGTAIPPMTTGNAVNVTESYQFTIGNVTQNSFNLWTTADNCHAVVFLQDNATKLVYQAHAFPVWPVSILETNDGIMKAKVYPNPLSSLATIDLNLVEDGNVVVELYNMLGERVQSVQYGQMTSGLHHVTFNAGEQPTGMYFVKIISNGQSITKKVSIN